MNVIERYPHWVEWSEEDALHIGRCPDLFLGGMHSDGPPDPGRTLNELREVMGDLVAHLREIGQPLPDPSPWPGRDSVFPTAPGVPRPPADERETTTAPAAERPAVRRPVGQAA